MTFLKSLLTWRFFLRSFFALILSCVLFVFLADWRVESKTDDLVYSDVQKIPRRKVGLLLGTSKLLVNGWVNLYFKYRIDAATASFKAGKIDYILISGDNGTKEYNEPEDMKQALIENGIPADKIVLDYAGFRTFDSVFRAEKIFGQKKFTIISQDFHTRRAIYIAQHLGLDAIGFNAEDVSKNYGFKTHLREKFARTNMFLDFLFSAKPKFLGKKILIDK
jgi:SanA protein